MHVHAKAGTGVRANKRKDEMKDVKTGGKKRGEKMCVKGKRMKGETT